MGHFRGLGRGGHGEGGDPGLVDEHGTKCGDIVRTSRPRSGAKFRVCTGHGLGTQDAVYIMLCCSGMN